MESKDEYEVGLRMVLAPEKRHHENIHDWADPPLVWGRHLPHFVFFFFEEFFFFSLVEKN